VTRTEPAASRLPARTRPRNRRALILAAAAALFAERGYEKITMSDIADAVAVRPSALYTHFSGKQDLLYATIIGEFQPARTLIANQSGDGVSALLSALAGFALDHRGLGTLWQRESRNLSEDEVTRLRDYIREAVEALGIPLRAQRPSLSPEQSELLVRCVLSVLLSTAQHRLTLPRPRFDELLTEFSHAVIAADVSALTGAEASALPHGSLMPLSRRESLLDAAIKLFARRSFASTSVEDIGAAVGIAGPSVYNHFASKAEMLASAVTRAIAGVRIDLSRVLSAAPSERDALTTLVPVYCDFAFTHSELIDVLVTEASNLPDDERAATQQSVRDYIAEWVHLIRAESPADEDVPTRIRVISVLSMINDVARTPHLRVVAGVRDSVASVAKSILLGTGHGVTARASS
jgi:AcrR family transcriptional regulator